MTATREWIYQTIVGAVGDRRRAIVRSLRRSDLELSREVRASLRANGHDEAAEGWTTTTTGESVDPTAVPQGANMPSIAGYRMLRILGSGGSGVVYEAEELHPRRRVALKVLHAARCQERSLVRFRREVQTVADLRLPCIPEVYAAGEYDGCPWVAMQIIDGVPLQHAIQLRPLRESLALLARVASTVHQVHSHGVLHCDLKPSNVLVTADGTPHILDFGVSSATRYSGDRSGTPLFMAPEQARGEALDARADVFSLGLIGWYSITGSMPPAGIKAFDQELRAVMLKATAADPDRRYDTAQAFADDLNNVVGAFPVSAQKPSWPRRATLFARRNRQAVRVVALLAAGTAIVVSAGAGAAWTVGAKAESDRNLVSQARLAQIKVRLTELESAGKEEAARATFDAFVQLEHNRHTPASAVARTWRAKQLMQLGRADDALHVMGDAYVDAGTAEARERALLDLAQWFDSQQRWSDLDAVLDRLAVSSERAAELRSHSALGMRRLDAAPASLKAWATGQKLGVSGHRADMSPWGSGRLVLSGVHAAHLFDPTDLSTVVETHPWPADTWISHKFPAPFPGKDRTYIGQTQDKSLQVWTDGSQRSALLPLGFGYLLGARSAPTQLGGVLIGMGGNSRLVRRIDEEDWSVSAVAPQVDRLASDVNEIVVGDLDGDGEQEVVVSTGPWLTYDVSVLTTEGDALQVDASFQLGHAQCMTILQTPVGPRVLAIKVDRYPNRLVLGSKTPFGGPSGAYLLRWQPGSLSVERFIPMPRQSTKAQCAGVYTGDIDGDQLEDVVVGLSGGSKSDTWALLGGVGGLRELGVVGGLLPLALEDIDNDGRADLIANLLHGVPDRIPEEQDTWVLGVGEQPVPALTAAAIQLPARQEEALDDVALESARARAHDLARVHLHAQAAEALLGLEAMAVGQADRELLRLEAASMMMEAGRIPAARRSLEQLAAAGGPRADDVRRLAARLALLDRDLDVETVALADAALREETARELGWRGSPQLGRRLDVSRPAGWRVVHDDAVLWRGGAIEIDAFHHQGIIARRSLRWPGGRLGLEVDIEVESLEFGAGVVVGFRNGTEVPALGVGVSHTGGGVDTDRVAGCLFALQSHQAHSRHLGRRARVRERVRLRVEWLEHVGNALCTVQDERGRELVRAHQTIFKPPTPGNVELVIMSGTPDRSTGMARARAQLHSVVVHGVTPAPADPERSGRSDAALDGTSVDDSLVATHRKHRRDPASALAHARVPDLEAHAIAWGDALSTFDVADLRQGMLLPQLDNLDGSLPEHTPLLYGRAMVFIERGELRRARTELDCLLAKPDLDDLVQQNFRMLRRRGLAARIFVARQLGEAGIEAAAVHRFAEFEPHPEHAQVVVDRLIAAMGLSTQDESR